MSSAVIFGGVAFVAVLLGLLLAVSAIRQFRTNHRRSRLRRDGVAVSATVVGNQPNTPRKGRPGFAPIMQYVTVSGREVRAPADDTRPSALSGGATMVIAYDPDEPEHFTMAAPRPGSSATFAVVLAILMITLACVAAWFSYRMANPDHQNTFDLPGIDVPGIKVPRNP